MPLKVSFQSRKSEFRVFSIVPWPSEFEVQKNDSLALIIEILYLKQHFLKRIVVC